MQVQQLHSLGIDPTVDYILPTWPTIDCLNPAKSDISQVVPSASFAAYLTAIQRKG